MKVSKYTHPKAHSFLSVSGFIPQSSQSASLPELDVLIHSSFSNSSDDQKYLLIPTILDILAAFYPHSDARFTLNEYLYDICSDFDDSTYDSLIR